MHSQQHPRLRATVLAITASLTLTTALAGSQDADLPNFQKVDDYVYRGGQPTNDGFKDLAQLGIKTVVDLRQTGEHSQADEEKVVTALGMRYISIPMKGLSRPKDDQVAAVLALLNDTRNGPVFVHCKRGADRTGMLIAVYRISHDRWENKKALSEAKSYGMYFFERAMQRYVMDYQPGAVDISAPAPAADVAASQPLQSQGTPVVGALQNTNSEGLQASP